MTKTAFVLSLPTLPIAEVVSRASSEGMKISPGYVATIRSKAKRSARPKPEAGKVRPALSNSIEAQFNTLAIELGLTRAEGLLSTLRTDVKRIALGR
jgi:hypothetical protein